MTVARTRAESVAAMLDARSVAVVGASARPDTFGARMVAEVLRGGGTARVELVNPRYSTVADLPCVPSLAALDAPPDLVLLGVGDHAVSEQLAMAASLGASGAVVFGSAYASGLREELTSIATGAGMALCGAGCMGFVNVASGLRALGYVERDDIAVGPISLVTHSGSVFSALLRTRRALGYSLAVSSGQELVTTTADYLDFVLDRTDTGLVGLVLETVREPARLRAALHRAAERDVPVVVLPVGGSPPGSAMVTAHSGAIAGADAMWEALCADTGMLRVSDLAEFTDTLELFALSRRPRGGGLAAVHDSGAERALTVDLAHRLHVPFAALSETTATRLEATIEPGLDATNPLDLWGTGAGTRELFAECLAAMAADPAVGMTVLAVDLVAEYDGDTSYADAVLDAAASGPIAVLTNLASAVDEPTAQRLRAAGVAVLEGTRSGLVALGHLLGYPLPRNDTVPMHDTARACRWRNRLSEGSALTASECFGLLGDYGLAAVPTVSAWDEPSALAAADTVGYPVVLKTDEPGIAHKSDVGGVLLDIRDATALGEAYRELATRLGPRVSVSASVGPGVEVSVGIARDPVIGLMVVVAAGGVFVELLADRTVALPPLDVAGARRMIDRLRIAPMLGAWRGRPAPDVDALVAAVVGVAQVALELGECIDALDVNPVIVTDQGAYAVDVLVERSSATDATNRNPR